MSREFDHVLLTRFSAVLLPGAPPADEDWLYYRLGFFLDACLPSVLSQRRARPFEWLVLLDDRCPDGFRAQVEELARGRSRRCGARSRSGGTASPARSPTGAELHT